MPTLTRPQIVIALGAIALFALTSVYGYGIFTGKKQQSGIGNQRAAAAASPDINGDGTVNVFDLSILLSAWNTTSSGSDLNTDGTVNVFDLSILLSKWGPVAVTPTPTPAGSKSVLSYGAKGDGTTDDTAAIQTALNSLVAGDVLVFPSGYTFRHTQVLSVNVAGVRLTGPATILATAEATSSFWINADNVTVDGGLVFKMGATTKRWDAFEQMKMRIAGKSGTRLTNITIDGSAAAGIYIGGASNFVLTDVTVKNTRADGIHMTGGSNNGQVIRPIVQNPGDDGVAIVSYQDGSPICNTITVTSPRLIGQQWGRAYSVVGGRDITETNVYAESSNAAAIYIAAESEWNTYGNTRVTFDGGTLTGSNTNATVDHGAVLVYSSQTGSFPNTDITVKNMAITNTRTSASRQVSVIQYGTAVQSRLSFANIAITGGGSTLFGGNAPANASNRTNWTWNGNPIPDVIGW